MPIDVDRIRAVVFDMDDTLINWQEAEHGAIGDVAGLHLAPQGIDEVTARRVYAGVMADNMAAYRADRKWWYVGDRLKILIERLGLTGRVETETLSEAFREHVTLRIGTLPGARETLDAVRSSGRRVGLLTNGPSLVQRPKLVTLQLAPYFDFVGVSGELGHWKPDPQSFLTVLERLGVPAPEALMVGDSLDFDIEPARRLGMQTCWIAPAGSQSPHADHVVQRVGELLPHFATNA